MYPIFITDDPDAQVDIPSLPGQSRWGINKLEGFLAPLVKKGLKSVILFGVPLSCTKVTLTIILDHGDMTLKTLTITGWEGFSCRRSGRPRHSSN